MKIFAYCCIGFIGSLFPYQAISQIITPDSSQLVSAVRVASQRYAAATEVESHLLNGTEYGYRAKPYLVGNQFFLTSEVQTGSLQYDGFSFAAVAMRYDCRADLLVVQPPSRAIALQLIPEKVAGFTLGGHHFVRLVTDSVASPQLRTGFYDLLVDGRARLLARHTKKSYERPTQAGMEGRFVETIRYYVQQDETYAEVAKLKDVVRLLPAKKADLQKFARTQHLSFKEGRREGALTALLAYYNTRVR